MELTKVVKVDIPYDEDTCLTAYQVEYFHISGKWRIHSVHQEECVARYIKEQLDNGRIAVPAF